MLPAIKGWSIFVINLLAFKALCKSKNIFSFDLILLPKCVPKFISQSFFADNPCMSIIYLIFFSLISFSIGFLYNDDSSQLASSLLFFVFAIA